MKAIEDRPAYFSDFFKAFFNVDVVYSASAMQRCHSQVGMCWGFCESNLICTVLAHRFYDLPCIDVPTLIIHGDADRILPLEHPPRPS